MALTAIVLLLVTRLWMHFGRVSLFPVSWSWQALALGTGLALIISCCSAIVYRLWPNYRHSADYYLDLVIKPLFLPDLVWLGLLPGLSEELLFRGVMLPELGANWEGIVISSLCFGALHLSGWKQWAYVVWATLVGGALGYSMVWSGNLFVPIVAHVLTNLISASLWKYRDGQRTG
jgi:membrane protease YdiL (CAAX protease family)